MWIIYNLLPPTHLMSWDLNSSTGYHVTDVSEELLADSQRCDSHLNFASRHQFFLSNAERSSVMTSLHYQTALQTDNVMHFACIVTEANVGSRPICLGAHI